MLRRHRRIICLARVLYLHAVDRARDAGDGGDVLRGRWIVLHLRRLLALLGRLVGLHAVVTLVRRRQVLLTQAACQKSLELGTRLDDVVVIGAQSDMCGYGAKKLIPQRN